MNHYVTDVYFYLFLATVFSAMTLEVLVPRVYREYGAWGACWVKTASSCLYAWSLLIGIVLLVLGV